MRVMANGSVWGLTDNTDNLTGFLAGVKSPRSSPDKERKRKRNIARNKDVMDSAMENLVRFISNNSSDRVNLLQIAMAPSEVCYRQ